MRITESQLRKIVREELAMNTATVDLATHRGDMTVEIKYTDANNLIQQVIDRAAQMEQRWASNYDEPEKEMAGWRIEPIITRMTDDTMVDTTQEELDVAWSKADRVTDYGVMSYYNKRF